MLRWTDYATGQMRAMTQEVLDAAMSPSQRVPSIDDELAKYAELSAVAREQSQARGLLHEGLAYGASPAATLDLLCPGGADAAPLLIYIHGGFWQQLGRGDSSFGASAINEAGGAWAAVGYTLAPHATLTQIVAQVREAVAWLYREADTLGLDRAHFVLAGSSAGAHLVASLVQTDWAAFGLPAQFLAGACHASGVYDLDAVRLSYVNAPLNLSVDDVATLSPLRHVAPSAVPAVIVHGDNETGEFKRESRLYAQALARHGQAVSVQEIAGRNHFDVALDLGDPTTFLGHSAYTMMHLPTTQRGNKT